MIIFTRQSLSKTLYLLIASSGFATLSWEVIWQIKSTLALGVSAWGTAITLATIMGGMSLGGFLMGSILRKHSPVQAIRLYGSLEMMAGLAGLFLNTALQMLEKLDTWVYTDASSGISLIYILGLVTIFGIPTLCIGATLPVFGLISQQSHVSLAKLYGLNTLGAALGVLIVAFIFIPLLGVTHTIWTISGINIMVGLSAWWIAQSGERVSLTSQPHTEPLPLLQGSLKIFFIVFATGFATFTLEVAWFRSLATFFPNTTDVFALILACMLIALGLAAKNISKLKQKKKLLGSQLSLAGIFILLVTPLIERLDNFFVYFKKMPVNENFIYSVDWIMNPDTFTVNWIATLLYACQILIRVCVIYLILIPPIRFLGVAFPWILDNQNSPHAIGKLYAVNTLSAIVGAIVAAWLLLPTLGFAKTAWVAGALVVIAGLLITPRLKCFLWAILAIIALLIAMFFETGIGKTRAQGFFSTDEQGKPTKVLDFFEGPEATISAVQYEDGTRALLINSALAAWESGQTYRASAHYMAWMGHLPMLLQLNPKKALVICFGTGQTANAVRKENPQELDIVDINANVFKLAHHFRSNEGVLNDPRVKSVVMDGRAYMRRTRKIYDVITLEPMPPNAIGVNALYSREFYALARKRLGANGVIAQWLPFHIVAPHYSASIAKTFMDVFPNAILWIDPDSKTGILLGTKDNRANLENTWVGFARPKIKRDLSPQEVQRYVMLNSSQLKRYTTYGEIISDDNQLLAYGKVLYPSDFLRENFALLHHINNQITDPQITRAYR